MVNFNLIHTYGHSVLVSFNKVIILLAYGQNVSWILIVNSQQHKSSATLKSEMLEHSMFWSCTVFWNHAVNVFDIQFTGCADRPAVPPRLVQSSLSCSGSVYETLPLQVWERNYVWTGAKQQQKVLGVCFVVMKTRILHLHAMQVFVGPAQVLFTPLLTKKGFTPGSCTNFKIINS